MVADAAARGHLLLDLEQITLDRKRPLALLPPNAPELPPSALPDTLVLEAPEVQEPVSLPELSSPPEKRSTVDASALPETLREQFHRNLRAVELVLAGASQTSVAKESGISRSTLSRLVQRTRQMGQVACIPHGSYTRQAALHPAFQECIRRLFLLPTRLSMTAIHEHTEMRQVAARLHLPAVQSIKLPSYDQVRREVHRLKEDPELVAVREGAKSLPRLRESPQSFALSIPSAALLTQVDEHSLELYVVTPDGIAVTQRVHAAVLICVKTAAILGAVLALGPLKEEDYMRLVKQALEPKDRLVGITGCEHPWPCYGKPAIIFHDRGRFSPPNAPARCWWIDLASLLSKHLPMRHQRRGPWSHSFDG